MGRHRALYLIPAQHPAPAAVRQRLDRLMERRLPEVGGRLLTAALASGTPDVWLIRNLEIEFSVDLGAVDDERLAEGWARRFCVGLGQAVARGADGIDVLHFADRGAYLACLIEDLVSDRAWGRWYYASFESLRSLGTSGAIREALVREPEWIVPVLARLGDKGALHRLITNLADGDARRILAAVSDSGAVEISEGRRLQVVLAVWRELGDPLRDRSRNLAALALLAHTLAQDSEIEPKSLLATIESLVDLAVVLRQIAASAKLMELLSSGDLQAAVVQARRAGVAAGIEKLAWISRLARSDPGWLDEVAQVVTAGRKSATVEQPLASSPSYSSPFASLFFLLPSALALGLDEMVEGSVELRHQVLARCFGAARFAAAVEDSALFEASGLEPDASPTSTLATNPLLNSPLVHDRRISGRYLAAQVVACGNDSVLLLRDIEADFWLVAEPVSAGEELVDQLLVSLSAIREAVEMPAELLLLEPEFERSVESVGVLDELPPHLLWMEEPDVTKLDEESGPIFDRFLTRAKPAAQELEYLIGHTRPEGAAASSSGFQPCAASPASPAAPEWPWVETQGWARASLRDAEQVTDLRIAIISHAILRHFAGRLMGFGWSGCEYLYKNFLAGEGSVRCTDEGLEVTLPRMPLHLVARMAGADGMSYTVPWLGRRQVTLELPKG